MYRYNFHCKQCGFHEECATKEDHAALRSWHKSEGCQLGYAPHKGGFILTRAELAKEAWTGMKITVDDEKKEEASYDIRKSNPVDG